MRVCAQIRLSSPPCPICTRVPAPSNLQEKLEENWLILIVPPPATGRQRLQTFQKSMKMKKIDWLLFAPESVRGSESEDVFWWLGGDLLTERGARFLSHGESFEGSGLNCLFVSTHIFSVHAAITPQCKRGWQRFSPMMSLLGDRAPQCQARGLLLFLSLFCYVPEHHYRSVSESTHTHTCVTSFPHRTCRSTSSYVKT